MPEETHDEEKRPTFHRRNKDEETGSRKKREHRQREEIEAKKPRNERIIIYDQRQYITRNHERNDENA